MNPMSRIWSGHIIGSSEGKRTNYVVIEVLVNFGKHLPALIDSSNSNLDEKQGDVTDGIIYKERAIYR